MSPRPTRRRVAATAPRLEPLEDRRVPATITVDSVSDGFDPSVLTLRQAIEVVDGTITTSSLSSQQAAQVSGTLGSNDTIDFDIPGTGVQTISPTTALPAVIKAVTIDGYSQPGSSPNTLATGDNAVILIRIDGRGTPAGSEGLDVRGAGGCLIEGLSITDFAQTGTPTSPGGGAGIDLYDTAAGNTVTGCFLGIDPTGQVAEPSDAYQVIFNGNSGTDFLGGPGPASRNVVETGKVGAGNPYGDYGALFEGETGPVIQGNYLGTNAGGNGTPAGVSVVDATALSLIAHTRGALIGGTQAGDANVIVGLWIGNEDGTAAVGDNVVEGNKIGVGAAGQNPFSRPSGFTGVTIDDSIGDIVGGTASGDGNMIVDPGGTAVYVTATDPATDLGTVIQGNSIGTDHNGYVMIGDKVGVYLDASGVLVGSPASPAGVSQQAPSNRIEYCTQAAVQFSGAAVTGDVVTGNSISSDGNPAIAGTPGLSPPVLNSAQSGPSGDEVKGEFRGAPDSSYTVEFYSFAGPPSAPEGLFLDGTATATTNANGRGTFDVSSVQGPGSYYLAATVTGSDPAASGGNTSGFSTGIAPDTSISAPADFNGDGLSDQGIYRPSTAQWFVRDNGGALEPTVTFGQAGFGDIPVVGDFGGVGHAEIAVFRPSTAQWFVHGTNGNTLLGTFGAPNLFDIPVPGDYDKTGVTELAVFRPSTSQWYAKGPNGSHLVATFGAPNLFDLPVPGDYDGVGYTEPAVYRPSTAQWFVDGPNGSRLLGKFGGPGDIPVPGDYDGVGHTEMAVFRPSTGQWFVDGPNGSHLLTVSTFGATNLFDYPVEAPVGALVKLGGSMHTMSVPSGGGSSGGSLSFGVSVSSAPSSTPPLPPSVSSASAPASRPSVSVLSAPPRTGLPASLLAGDATRLRRRVAQ